MPFSSPFSSPFLSSPLLSFLPLPGIEEKIEVQLCDERMSSHFSLCAPSQCHRSGERSFVEILEEAVSGFGTKSVSCVHLCIHVWGSRTGRNARLLCLKRVKSLCVPANSVPKAVVGNRDRSFPLQTLLPAPADQDRFLWLFAILKTKIILLRKKNYVYVCVCVSVHIYKMYMYTYIKYI